MLIKIVEGCDLSVSMNRVIMLIKQIEKKVPMKALRSTQTPHKLKGDMLELVGLGILLSNIRSKSVNQQAADGAQAMLDVCAKQLENLAEDINALNEGSSLDTKQLNELFGTHRIRQAINCLWNEMDYLISTETEPSWTMIEEDQPEGDPLPPQMGHWK
ncbi:hypothetical protein BDV25DRAFT_135097 [Aspergillus avenaceus]|uniref:Uncharacterized protein n=1 Tax=Aspergillus avenaceus TaxID=36643 RepID=A0A5N6U9S3_ASPAV|nr:hypothetical protein BDV25DRAFT_135097 [Aspergillus avenaceus]